MVPSSSNLGVRETIFQIKSIHFEYVIVFTLHNFKLYLRHFSEAVSERSISLSIQPNWIRNKTSKSSIFYFPSIYMSLALLTQMLPSFVSWTVNLDHTFHLIRLSNYLINKRLFIKSKYEMYNWMYCALFAKICYHIRM